VIVRCNVPLLLRLVSTGNDETEVKPFHYVLIGGSYVHGLMLGEYIRKLRPSEKGVTLAIH
jgi:hypothetical protein